MDFTAIVLYTYGGFHRSALRFIKRLGGALDTASSLYSLTEWKRSLKEHMAMAVQRGSADIMILHSQRARSAGVGRVWKRHHARLRQLARVQEQLVPPPIGWYRSDGRITGLMDLSPSSSAGDGSGGADTSVDPVRDNSAPSLGVSELVVNASDNNVISATVSPVVDNDLSDIVASEEVRQPILVQNIGIDPFLSMSDLEKVHVVHDAYTVHSEAIDEAGCERAAEQSVVLEPPSLSAFVSALHTVYATTSAVRDNVSVQSVGGVVGVGGGGVGMMDECDGDAV